MMKMKVLKSYDIKFSGLKNGKHQYKFHLDRDFFESFDYDEFGRCNIDILVDFNKSDSLFEFNIYTSGTVELPCDVSGDPYDQNIEGELDFIVKFGPKFNDDRDDLIILPYQAHRFNIAQQIYESVILSLPSKRVHPDILSGKKANPNAKYMVNDDTSSTNEGKEENNQEIDPRWAALKKILTDKKQ